MPLVPLAVLVLYLPGPPAAADSGALPLRQLAPGVYAIPGDSGRGMEGRPNAGFVVTSEGVVAIDALASPRDGRRLLQTIASVTEQPVRWLILTHHHPDHHFGAIALRRAGARVIAHPDTRVLAAEGGKEALVADWAGVVGRDAMRGFEFANVPDRPVTAADTLRLGEKTLVVLHPGPGHSAGDLLVWLPAERVLFAGDVLVEDGVTMMVDGGSAPLLETLAVVDALDPRTVVTGHGGLSQRPGDLVARTRGYVIALREDMRAAVEQGMPMRRALASLPPADETRPISLNSRQRRNAVRVYLEEEKRYLGLEVE